MAEYPFWEYLDDESQELLKSLSPSGWKPPVSKPPRYKIELEDIEEIARILREPGHIERRKDW